MNANAELFALLASESDREAARRMQTLPIVLALIPVCAVVWGYAITAVIELLGVL